MGILGICAVGDPLGLAVGLVLTVAVIFYVKLFILHPLSPYPGPLLGRCTTLYAAYHGWLGSIHTDIYRCHQKYGPVVRYGPNRLLVDSNVAVKDIYSQTANTVKSTAYRALIHGAANTLTIRRKEEHVWRRRILARALSDSRVRYYEDTLQRHIDALCLNLDNNAKSNVSISGGQSLDMSELCNYFSFDTMADVIFGVRYSSLREPKYRFVPKALEASNVRVSALFQSSILKLGRLDRYIFPTAIRGRNRFLGFVSSLLRDRSSLADDDSVFSFLENGKDADGGKALSRPQVRAECASLVVAGSDTTSTALAATLFYLSRNPSAYQRVRREVRDTLRSLDHVKVGPLLSSCVYLRACIDEALRMSPPAGCALWREVGPGGMLVDSVVLPAGVDVGVGIYSLHHNETYHKHPFKYLPERWLAGEGTTTKEEVALCSSAFLPFSVGPRSCVGKGFAYHQMALTLAHIIHKFEFRHADETDYGSWSREGDEYLLKDQITGAKSGPFLLFKLRDVDSWD